MRLQGASNAQIARAFGITTDGVRGMVSKAARDNGERKCRAPKPFKPLRRRDNQTITVPVSPDIADDLMGAAKVRNITVTALVTRLVAAVVDDGLINSVLDDMP